MLESDPLRSLLEEVLIGGLERREITISDYNPEWPLRFEVEGAKIRKALGTAITGVEHVGSTSVPGLAAKPIVDIIVLTRELKDESAYVPQFERIGYHLRVREPGHLMFRSHAKDVHVHMWATDEEVQRHIAFRDWLREHPDDRHLYEQTKLDLSKQSWDDMNYYAEAKSAVIATIMERALNDQRP